MATQSDREIELSQTNRGVGRVCVGVVPRVQSKLSRALHAHRGKKLLQDLQTQESAATKSFARRYDEGPPVEGNLRQESGVA